MIDGHPSNADLGESRFELAGTAHVNLWGAAHHQMNAESPGRGLLAAARAGCCILSGRARGWVGDAVRTPFRINGAVAESAACDEKPGAGFVASAEVLWRLKGRESQAEDMVRILWGLSVPQVVRARAMSERNINYRRASGHARPGREIQGKG